MCIKSRASRQGASGGPANSRKQYVLGQCCDIYSHLQVNSVAVFSNSFLLVNFHVVVFLYMFSLRLRFKVRIKVKVKVKVKGVKVYIYPIKESIVLRHYR